MVTTQLLANDSRAKENVYIRVRTTCGSKDGRCIEHWAPWRHGTLADRRGVSRKITSYSCAVLKCADCNDYHIFSVFYFYFWSLRQISLYWLIWVQQDQKHFVKCSKVTFFQHNKLSWFHGNLMSWKWQVDLMRVDLVAIELVRKLISWKEALCRWNIFSDAFHAYPTQNSVWC